MKINICVGGRFHANQLSDVVFEKYKNVNIYSSSPKKNWPIILQKKIVFIPMPFAILAYIFKFKINKKLVLLDRLIFDFILSLFIRDADIYHMWAGYSYITMKKIRKNYKKSKIILERSCPHILEQKFILTKEAEKRNINLRFDLKMDVNRQIREYDLADFIVVPSIYTKNSFKNYKDLKDKIILTRLSSNIKNIKVDKLSNKKLKKIIGFIGDFSPRKGIWDLLEAYDKSDIDFNLILKMDRISTSEKKFINSLKRKKQIIIKGYYDHLSDFYKSIDLLVVPSIDEGFGMVVIESLSHFKPVIVRNTVGSSNLVNNKMGFKFSNVDELIKIFKTIHVDNKIINEKVNYLKSLKLNFDKHYRKDVLSLYRNLNKDS